MSDNTKGTWCALPDDKSRPLAQTEEAPGVLDLLDPYTNSFDDGNLLKLQALESEKKEDLPLAVASPDSGDGEFFAEKPTHTDEKKGGCRCPCWAKLMFLLLLLLLGIATASLAMLARMNRRSIHVAASNSQNEQLVSPLTDMPTQSPTASPTTSPTLRPTPHPTSRPVVVSQATLHDDQCDDEPFPFLCELFCFFLC